MDITTQIFNALNNDPESMKLLNSLNEATKKDNATKEEYLKAREMILLAAVLQNKTAFSMLADYVYTEINKGANYKSICLGQYNISNRPIYLV